MALVEGQDSPRVETVGEDHDGQVREPDVQVGVPSVDVGRQRVLVTVQALHEQPTGGEVVEEGPAGPRTESSTQQVVDLGGDRRGDDHSTRLPANHLFDRGVLRIGEVGGGHERGGVHQQRRPVCST